MRVPHLTASPTRIPGADETPLRHDTVLGAPRQNEAGSAAFRVPVTNLAAVAEGVSGLERIGRQVLETMRRERDATTARDAAVNLNAAFILHAYGDGSPENPGVYGRKGKEAFDAVIGSREWFEKAVESRARGMNANAAKDFRDQAALLRMSSLPGIARHEARERNDYAAQSMAAQAAVERGNALANAADPVRYNEFLTRQEAAERDRAAKLGLSEEETAQSVNEALAQTIEAVFEKQVGSGAFTLAKGLYQDPRLPEAKKVMLADAYRRARLENEMALAGDDPEEARERLAALRKAFQPGAANPLALGEKDFATLENKLHAENRRREAEKDRQGQCLAGRYEEDFLAALRSGDLGPVLEAEESLLALDREEQALRSRHARETYAQALPVLEAGRNMDFAAQARAIEDVFAPMLPPVGEEAGMRNVEALILPR